MRSISPMLAALAPLFAAPAASAAQIAQNLLAAETIGDLTPVRYRRDLFDPALGTLTSVTGELTGIVRPSVVADDPPFPTALLGITWRLFSPLRGAGPGERFQGRLPDQIAAPAVLSAFGPALYEGSPTPVDLTFNFANPSVFIGSSSLPAALLSFGFRTSADIGHISSGSDDTRFNGNFRLTYTYQASVPEPSGLPTLAAGVLALAAVAFPRRQGSCAS